MYSVKDDHRSGRVSPFGNPRIKASLQAPRGLSHATTSFIASCRLGIHRMRLFTWPYNPKQSAMLAHDKNWWSQMLNCWYKIQHTLITSWELKTLRCNQFFEINQFEKINLAPIQLSKFLMNWITPGYSTDKKASRENPLNRYSLLTSFSFRLSLK